MAESFNKQNINPRIENYTLAESVNYPNGGISFFYTLGDKAIIVDQNIWQCESQKDIYPYSLITDKQNQYIKKYASVYRFIDGDAEEMQRFLSETPSANNAEYSRNAANRESVPDASALEYYFEKQFLEVYGNSALKYLIKEYGINDNEGHTYFLDYLIRTKDKQFGIEENGINYHHPQVIGKEAYRRQLHKQNTCTEWGIKLFRFSTEDCKFENRINDDIVSFFGRDASNFLEIGIDADRNFRLYEHQSASLQDIENARKSNCKSFLIVFPTATGKSKIVEEDMRRFASEHNPFRALILVPSKNISEDWEKRVAVSLPEFADSVEIKTYSYACRHFLEHLPNHYNYIVVDEAHHAVAPTLKRVIQYYNPEFLIGMTATDQRPDRKKLETIFGTYKTGLSLEQAMKDGIIAKANVYRIETNLNLSHVRFNGKDYVNSDLEKSIRITSRNQLIADVLKEYFCGGTTDELQGLIFCVNTNHAREMAKLLNENGISASDYTGKSKNPEKIMQQFKNKEIRFLCTCQMISEGWDYPELGIIVMARPTMSKVLYLQQIGRGLRKTSKKNNVFIIDVVDEYGAMAVPCSMHSIFHNAFYVPFGEITNRSYSKGDIIEVAGIHEVIERIHQININSFEEEYGDYLSAEQLARKYFVSTGTINTWVRKERLIPSAAIPFGNKQIYLFSPEYAEQKRAELGIKDHNEDTIYEDFFEFLEERDYSLSYKMPFLLGVLNHLNEIGDAPIDDVLSDYIAFYEDRISKGLTVDRSTCPYTSENLKDRAFIRSSMLTNPFEKFERKRFLYYSKDLGMISMNHALYSRLNESDINRIREQMKADMENYYRNL